MAEDSGAFKTNPRNSAQIGHFVIAADGCGKDASPPEKHGPSTRSRSPAANFVTNSFEALRYSRIGLIRDLRSRLCGHRVPFKPQRPDQGPPPKAEPATMLPGFRFLFAAILLSMSVLVFGLGAAALLRAAHEEFASMPSRRAPPQPVFAQPSEPTVPTLALLRVEPSVAEKAPDDVAAATTGAEPAPDVTPPAEPEKLAALKPEDAAPAEAAKPEPPAVETTSAPPAETEAPASVDEPKLAAIAETPPPASEAASTPAEPATEVPSAAASIAATKIATLGGPAVTIEEPASVKAGANVRSASPKRTKERRRIARRARPAAPQPAADPFAQSATAVRSR
jgi:hypothetical protein